MMILSEFSYKNASGWMLENLSLNHQNLVVGMNAVGKSRTVSAIGHVASIIKGDMDAAGDFSCSLLFKNGSNLEYSFEVIGGQVFAEVLKKNGLPLIQRERYSAMMYDDRTVSPPDGKLLIQVRRDTKKYPDIEEIILWAEHTSLFVFSNITAAPNSLSPYTISEEPQLPVMFGKIPDEQKDLLKEYMRDLSYNIDDIVEYEMVNGGKALHIYESGIKLPLKLINLSNGMFRVLSVLLYMIYSSNLSDARCMMIDDLGEGLDYMRSTKLGKIMFEFCEKNHIQLIATSNDSFLMDAVDLQHWNILKRRYNRVYSINWANSQPLFEKFQRTGLSNFDILSSNFLANNTSDE